MRRTGAVRGAGVLAALMLVAVTVTATVAATSRPARADVTSLAVIGDSLTYGMAKPLGRELARVGWTDVRIDGVVGRRIPAATSTRYSGVKTLRAMRAKGFDPPAYVIALGTNDVDFIGWYGQSPDALVEEMLAAIGPGRLVLWVDVVRADMPVAAGDFNRALDAAAQRHPELVVYHWSSVALGHPEWTAGDGMHLTPAGYAARARLVAEASRALREGSIPPEAYPPTPPPPPDTPLVAPAVLLRAGSRGAAVRELQHTMRSSGWFFGRLTSTYGATTTAGVKRMQRALTTLGFYRGALNGRYDAPTQAALVAYLAALPPASTVATSPA